jgi:hypothetical protein
MWNLNQEIRLQIPCSVLQHGRQSSFQIHQRMNGVMPELLVLVGRHFTSDS